MLDAVDALGHLRPDCDHGAGYEVRRTPTVLHDSSFAYISVKTQSMDRFAPPVLLVSLRQERARHPAAQAGFTLLEMLIVLVIIGLLAALVGPRLLDRLDASKVTTTEVQVRNLRTALDTLRLDIGRYPTTDEGLALLMNPPSDPDLRAKWRGPYLEDALPNDAWGHPFVYAYTGTGNPPYALYSYGAEGKPSADGTIKGIGVLPPQS
jgi:general secretion pathway protein G